MIRLPLIRLSLTGLAALMLVAAPAAAQQATPAATAPSAAPAGDPGPGSGEWLRVRGETYPSGPESAQDPAEISATARLNEEIAARSAAAEQSDAVDRAHADAERERWREETARANTARVQWESDTAAANAAQAQWERDRAAYEAEVAACRAASRRCIVPQG
mgnify:CR=1 FL=1